MYFTDCNKNRLSNDVEIVSLHLMWCILSVFYFVKNDNIVLQQDFTFKCNKICFESTINDNMEYKCFIDSQLTNKCYDSVNILRIH